MNKKIKDFIVNIFVAVLTLAVVSMYNKNTLIASSALIILSIAYLFYYKDKTTTIVYLIGAIGGPLAEVIAIKFGTAWGYSTTTFLSIPFWLIFVWGNAAAFIYQSGLLMRRIIKNDN